MTENVPAIVAEPPAEPVNTGRDQPVSLSFPTILRNPKFVHLNVHSINQRQVADDSATQASRKKDPRDKDGKRRIRRQENSTYSLSCVRPLKPIAFY